MRYGSAVVGLVLALGLASGDALAQADTSVLQRHRLSAAQGDPAGLDGLGALFERGSGVPVDFPKAYTLYHLAASRRSADPALIARATEHRDTLGARMSAAQLARVNELIALCNGSDVNRCGEIIIGAGAPGIVASVRAAGSAFRTSADGKTIVPLEPEGGVYMVPAVINGVMTLQFTVDTGAADVSIPADVVASLVASGFITQDDFMGEGKYQLADGSIRQKQQFRIRSLHVGNVVVENLRGSVSPAKAPPLLGQSFLSRVKSWSMDSTAHTLTIE